MRRAVVIGLALLVATSAALMQLRARWIDAKIAAATTVAPVAAGTGSPRGCGEPTAIAVTGDSRVSQWPMRLFGRASVANTGIAGETALQLASRFDRDVLAYRPRTVLIGSGINDLVAASLAAGPRARTIAAHVPALLIGLAERAAAAGSVVYVATVVPPARPDLLRRLVWSDAVRGFVQSVNAALRAHPWPQAVTLVDFAAALDPQDTGVLPDRFRRDTLHLNEAAYACLTKLLPFAMPPAADAAPGCPVQAREPGFGGAPPRD